MKYIFLKNFRPRVLIVCLLAIAASGCKKDQNLKKLEDFFDYVPYVMDSTIRMTGKAKDTILPSSVPFNFTAEFQGYAFPACITVAGDKWIMAVNQYPTVNDFQASWIVAKESTDGGKTWGEEYVLQENIGKVQTCSPSFLRVSAQEIWLIFLVKHSHMSCDVYYKVSKDEGKTWGEPRKINTMEGYHVVNNSRVLKLGNRIIIPVAYSTDIYKYYDRQGVFCFISDDYGASWKISSRLATTLPLMEPGITALSNQELLMTIRSTSGKILFSRSSDGGMNWTTPVMTAIDSPESPATLYTFGNSGKLMLVWNNNNGIVPPEMKYSNRQPLTISYSSDKGRTWSDSYNIEWVRGADYSYVACYEQNNNIYLIYNVRPHGGLRMYTKMLKLK